MDPFTQKDSRYLQGQMLLEEGSTMLAGLNIHHVVDGGVQFDIGFDESGSTNRRVDATLQFLLDDGSVVALRMVETALPLSNIVHGPFGHGIYTTHLATGVLPVADVKKLAAAKVITQLRHDLLSVGSVTRKLHAGASKQIIRAMVCATGA